MEANERAPGLGVADDGRAGPGTRDRAVLLIDLGTPESPRPGDVRRYLSGFLSDPRVVRAPSALRWAQRPAGCALAWIRAGRSAEMYRAVWTESGSPGRAAAQDRAAALERALPKGWRVYRAERHGRPTIGGALEAMRRDGVGRVVVVPMFPQYSGPMTGSVLDELYRQLRQGGHHLHVEVRTFWHDDEGYVQVQAGAVFELARRRELDPGNCWLLFSAHAAPEAGAGDPYRAQVEQSARLVAARLGWPRGRWSLAFQGWAGPVRATGPRTEEELARLAGAGERRVLACPISFAADCVRTLAELGIACREGFERLGGELHVCPALNAGPEFIKALALLVRRGRHAAAEVGVKPLLGRGPGKEDLELGRLAMVGVTQGNPLGAGRGPAVRYTDAETFRAVKRPQAAALETLARLRESGLLRECVLWNTCNRFEVYGWLSEAGAAAGEAGVERIAAIALGDHASEANVLHGSEAWHHLVRTAAGLNSKLPGDTELVGQLGSACRMAEHAGTGGVMTERLAARAAALVEELRAGTAWGRFAMDYCALALERFAVDLRPGAKVLAVGGSVTSHSVLSALRERFGVDDRGITLAYRGERKGRLVKMLRGVVGRGRTLVVESYADERIADAAAVADAVFLASDGSEPIVTGARLAGRRDFASRPLLVMDFNGAGSTAGLELIDGVRVVGLETIEREIGALAAELARCEAFRRAVGEAEAWIAARAEVCAGTGRSIRAAESVA